MSREVDATTTATAGDAILDGLTEIAQEIDRSPKTTLRWIRERGLPAAKVGKGYLSTRGAIIGWARAKAEGNAA